VSTQALETLIETPRTAGHERLLQQVCKALDLEVCRLQYRDKGLLTRLNSTAAVRYKIKGKISAPWEKAFITIQVVLAKDDSLKLTQGFNQDCKKIMARTKRLVSCLVELLTEQPTGLALRNAIELEGAINGEAWHEMEAVLRQVNGIGPSYASLLTKAGLGTLGQLITAQPSQIEIAVKRNPPFGHQILDACRNIPKLKLSCAYTDQNDQLVFQISCEAQYSGKNTCHLLVISKEKGDHQVLLFETRSRPGITEKTVRVNYSAFHQELTVSWICSSHAGLNIHKVIQVGERAERKDIETPPMYPLTPVTPKHMAKGTIVEMNDPTELATGLETELTTGLETELATGLETEFSTGLETELATGLKTELGPELKVGLKGPQIAALIECKHRCKDKSKCRHSCCKGEPKGRKRKVVTTNETKRRRLSDHSPLKKVQVSTIRVKSHEQEILRDLVRPYLHKQASVGSDSSAPTSEIILPAVEGVKEIDAFVNLIRGLKC
jgi:ATP-dependent DNA helicase HFM1/MER3